MSKHGRKERHKVKNVDRFGGRRHKTITREEWWKRNTRDVSKKGGRA